jgi:hypothetical protein
MRRGRPTCGLERRGRFHRQTFPARPVGQTGQTPPVERACRERDWPKTSCRWTELCRRFNPGLMRLDSQPGKENYPWMPAVSSGSRLQSLKPHHDRRVSGVNGEFAPRTWSHLAVTAAMSAVPPQRTLEESALRHDGVRLTSPPESRHSQSPLWVENGRRFNRARR